jgi:hypothetical protein
MDSPSEKYPALARALDKKILDGEGNELTTEAAIEMLISSEEYFPPPLTSVRQRQPNSNASLRERASQLRWARP